MSNQEHIKNLISINQRHLQALQLQQAKMGLNTPTHITLEIEDIEAELKLLLAQLEASPAEVAPGPNVAQATGEKPEVSKPVIFISYSHNDEPWKDRLMTQLRVLQLEGRFDIWEDRQIATGDDWYPEIEKGITNASLAIFLISANFLGSNFIRSEEIPRLLNRRAKEGLRVFPIIVTPCPWQRVEWLAKIQVRPKDGKPLASGSEYDVDEILANIALEIDELLRDIPTQSPASASTASFATSAEVVYKTGAIRKLLTAAFTDEDFTIFCYDNFRKVGNQFSTGMSFSQKVQRLIEHCEKDMTFEYLLQLIAQEHPAQYQRFESQLKR